MSGVPLAVIGSSAWRGSSYNLATDTRILDWYEADTGVTSKAVQPKFGNLVAQGGAVATATLNGQPVFAFRSGSGGCYATASDNFDPIQNPYHLFFLIQDVGSASQGTYFGNAQARPLFQYTNGTTLNYGGQGFTAAPAGWHLYEIYQHGSKTMVSIDGGTYIPLTGVTGINNTMVNLVLGAAYVTGNRCDANMALALVYEGQGPDAFKTALYSYIASKYGIALAAPRAQINVDPTDPSLLLSGTFDIIVTGGQSNMVGLSTVATTSPAAGILYLEGGMKVAQMPDRYGLDTSRIDEISRPAPGYTMANMYGPAGAIANPYATARGRQVVMVNGALAGAAIVPAARGSFPWYYLGTDYPRGYKLRDSVYGSMLAQVKWLQSRGGTVRFVTYYQGEAEANAARATGDLWPAAMKALWAEFFADIGMAGQEKVVYVQLAPLSAGADWPYFRTTTQPLAQVAGKFIMVSAPNGPYEADNIHGQGAFHNTLGASVTAAALAAGW